MSLVFLNSRRRPRLGARLRYQRRWLDQGRRLQFNFLQDRTAAALSRKNEYTTRPARSKDEWVYRQHPEDWQNYHTRYVTPQVFKNALRSELLK